MWIQTAETVQAFSGQFITNGSVHRQAVRNQAEVISPKGRVVNGNRQGQTREVILSKQAEEMAGESTNG